MRERTLIESGGQMNRDEADCGAIWITIPSYSSPDTAFALPVQDAPPRLLEALKKEGATFTAVVGTGRGADPEHLAGRFGWYSDEPEDVSISDLEPVAEAEAEQ